MILFLDEDRAYLNWVSHHRMGFVLDCLRHPTKAHLTLHRATCPEIKRSASKRTHWTTGNHMKGCSLDLEQLKAWAKDQTQHEPANCSQCSPQQELDSEIHLTRLDRDVLETVLEFASVHIDEDDHAYFVTVGMMARCFGKTEGQLMSSLARLVDDGLLFLGRKFKPDEIPSPRCGVYPTTKALRTIPDFAAMTDEQLAVELRKLTPAT